MSGNNDNGLNQRRPRAGQPQQQGAAQPSQSAGTMAGQLGSNTPTPPSQHHRIGAGNFRSSLRTNNGRRAIGEYVNKYRESLSKIIEESGVKEARVLVMDAGQHGLRLSSLVVAVPIELPGGTKLVTAFTLIVEASSSSSVMPKQDINIGTGNLQIPLTAGEVFNTGYKNKVLDMVGAEFPGFEPRSAWGMVLYRELQPTDEVRLKEVAFYALEACMRTPDLISGGQVYDYFSLDAFDPSDRVKAYITNHPQNVEDACGLPIRADISVEITAEPAVQQDKFNPQIDHLTTIFGYPELLYYHNDQQQMYQGWGQAPTQRYIPRFNITAMRSNIDIETLELRMFGLYNAMILLQGHAWSAPLRPTRNPNDKSLNTRDITAIGYECPAYCKHNGGKPDRVKGAGEIFTDQDFAALLREAVDPTNIQIAMHIEECGEMTWLDSVLWLAANNDPASISTVIAALDRLTHNGFSKYFDPQQHKLFIVDQNRMIRGYRSDMTNRYDLLELDSLAMLNILGAAEVENAIAYDKTFIENAGLDANARMAQRLKQQTDLLEETMEVKAYGLRIIATNELLLAIDAAVADMNFKIQPQNIFTDAIMGQRGTAVRDLGRTGLSAARLSGVFRNQQSSTTGGGLNTGMTWGARRS